MPSARTAVAAALVLVAAAIDARALDMPLAGKKLGMRDGVRARLVLLTRDRISAPAPGLADDPKLTILQDLTAQSSFMGYPGGVTAPADEVWQSFLIPQMFAKYIKGADLDVAVKSTEETIKKVYAKWQA